MVGYPAALGLLASYSLFWLRWWLDLWKPAVNMLGRCIPSFAYVEQVLNAHHLEQRIDLTQNVLAFEWTMLIPILVYLSTVVIRIPGENFANASSSGLKWTARLLGAAALSLVPLYWAIFGTPSESPLFAWHRSNFALAGIGVDFFGIVFFGIGLEIIGRGAVIAFGANAPKPS
jgi:hypothetical protein